MLAAYMSLHFMSHRRVGWTLGLDAHRKRLSTLDAIVLAMTGTGYHSIAYE